jgi:hypothetical protein
VRIATFAEPDALSDFLLRVKFLVTTTGSFIGFSNHWQLFGLWNIKHSGRNFGLGITFNHLDVAVASQFKSQRNIAKRAAASVGRHGWNHGVFPRGQAIGSKDRTPTTQPSLQRVMCRKQKQSAP